MAVRVDVQTITPPELKSKYHRMIGQSPYRIAVDVYDVLKAFEVTCPARQHAIKKLLAAGKRGSKTEQQDLQEAISSIQRSIELL